MILSKNYATRDFFGPIIKKNEILIELDLSYNDYDFDGIQSILKGLEINKSIKKLNIEGMRIGEINVHKFCDVFKENNSLQTFIWDLDIDENDLDLV